MSIYRQSGARGLERFPSLKYNNVQIGSGAGKLTRRQPKTKKNWQWRCNFLAAHTSIVGILKICWFRNISNWMYGPYILRKSSNIGYLSLLSEPRHVTIFLFVQCCRRMAITKACVPLHQQM